MAEVDPDDDTAWRWVVFHRRFDPARRERREVVVAAYDNEAEFQRELDRYSARVREEIGRGARDRKDWAVSGRALHPGYRDEQARGHLVRRAIEHGVDPRPLLADGHLPSNMAVFGVGDDGESFHFGGGQPPKPPGADTAHLARIPEVVAIVSAQCTAGWWRRCSGGLRDRLCAAKCSGRVSGTSDHRQVQSLLRPTADGCG